MLLQISRVSLRNEIRSYRTNHQSDPSHPVALLQINVEVSCLTLCRLVSSHLVLSSLVLTLHIRIHCLFHSLHSGYPLVSYAYHSCFPNLILCYQVVLPMSCLFVLSHLVLSSLVLPLRTHTMPVSLISSCAIRLSYPCHAYLFNIASRAI